MKPQFRTEVVSVDCINKGDTVMIDGDMTTIGNSCIKSCPIMGTTVQGRRMKTVERVLFAKWLKGEIIGYQAQI